MAVRQLQAKVEQRSDHGLCFRFLEQTEIDSGWELFLWLRLLAMGAQPVSYSTLAAGFRKHAVVDAAGERLVGDLRRVALVVELPEVQLMLFPQVPVRSFGRSAYCLDALVCVRRGRQKWWIDFEVDGPGHDLGYDLERQRALGLPTLRLRAEDLRAEDLAALLVTRLHALEAA